MKSISAVPGDFLRGRAANQAFSSMHSADADIIARAVAEFGDRWSTITHDDYNGRPSILIEPAGTDQDQSSYYVSGTLDQLELDRLYKDELSSVGIFESVSALLGSLKMVLAE